jgi:biotin carboxylase
MGCRYNEGMIDDEAKQRRVLLLLTTHTYRAPAFLAAAEQLGIEIVQALDMPRQLVERRPVELGLDYQDVDTAVTTIAQYAQTKPFDAILSVDDSGSLLAARASTALGLPHNDPAAAEAARNKYRMRQLLHRSGILSPRFRWFSTIDDVKTVAAQVSYPGVVKPLTLSGSRGVMRVNDEADLGTAVTRLTAILDKTGPGPHPYLVEDFIPGVEVALEGMLDNGRLTVLALFDKPDPLDGPFFEETIYTTPSRLPEAAQTAIANCTAQAAAALGLRRGPVHAELRLNDDGPWLVEIAGRSIGGLCSQTLRFGQDVSLEALILRQACGLPWQFNPAPEASGVMMIPIPEAGLLKGVAGIEAAEAVPLIESVEITAPLNYPLTPLPEGESYLGFIFARGKTATAVEQALRDAHSKLQFKITPLISLAVNRNL